MNLFISGWAGFREALGDIPEDWYFINPFLDFDEKGILDFLNDKLGDTVIGWSTGGHIVLKNLKFFSDRFNEIIIVAGFRKFTNYVNQIIIKRMIKKMATEPETVVKNFLTNAGCKPLIPGGIDFNKLIKGLEFLLYSDVFNSYCELKNIIFIQGLNDKILPIKAIQDLKITYTFAQVNILKSPHWVTFDEILKTKASGTTRDFY